MRWLAILIPPVSLSDVDGLQSRLERVRVRRDSSGPHPRRESVEVRYYLVQQVSYSIYLKFDVLYKKSNLFN